MSESPSEYPRSVSSNPKKTLSFSLNTTKTVTGIAIIAVAVIAFWLGTLYHHPSSTPANQANSSFGYFGHGGGGFGTVSSVSSTSITVQNPRSGTTKTYTITGSTKISDNGQSASASSIAVGDRVVIMPSSSASSDAATILLNPSFGGGFNNNGSSSTGSSTSD